MDQLRCMEAFVKVVEMGSFTSAGESLNVSQQMMAKYISKLEQKLNTRLLNRTTRKQSLTEFGKYYFDHCQRVLKDIAEVNAFSHELSHIPKGKIRISAPKTFGSYSLAPFIARFIEKYPQIELDINLSDHRVDVHNEGYEVVFRIGPLSDGSLVARQLPSYQVIACASPDYLAKHGEPKHPQDLSQHQCLDYLSESPIRCNVWQFYQHGQALPSVPVSSRVTMNDSQALLAAAMNGAGITLTPYIMVQQALKSGQLIHLLKEYEGPSRSVHLLYPQDKYRTAKVKCFIEEALHYYRNGLVA